jgi:cytidylate kinase
VIRVITIEREYGCGAAAIAKALADRLGWKLWDQRLTQEIADLAHCRQSDISKREERRDRSITACSSLSPWAAMKAGVLMSSKLCERNAHFCPD